MKKTNRQDEPYGNVRVCCSCMQSAYTWVQMDHYRQPAYKCLLLNKQVKADETCRHWKPVPVPQKTKKG